MSSRGRFAMPADSPRHDGSPYRGLHARRWGLGVVHRSRSILCRAVPNLSVANSRLFSVAVGSPAAAAFATRAPGGLRRHGHGARTSTTSHTRRCCAHCEPRRGQYNTPVPTTSYSPGGGTTAHSVPTSRSKPVPTTPYSPGGGGTAHSVLTAHSTPVPTTPYSLGGGTRAHSVLDSPQHTGAHHPI
jgi:hypothetical protein